jgi:predicted RNA binding protein YcfA (HicA-like mRNA interferase family)
MAKFPTDAPKDRVLKALKRLGFQIVREREHISMVRENEDGSRTPLTLPNHPRIKGSTLRTICVQSNISRDDFLRAYEKTEQYERLKRRCCCLCPLNSSCWENLKGVLMIREKRNGALLNIE